jgi:hypothetical protein
MTGKGMLNDMAFLTTRMFVLSLLPLLVIPTHAQKQERPCNVVARVNGDIISVLDDLIDELLLAQRGKELGFDADVELKRLEEIIPGDRFPQFHDELRKQEFDLEQARASRRRQVLGQRAIQIEVLEPIFRSITDSERRDFYG